MGKNKDLKVNEEFDVKHPLTPEESAKTVEELNKPKKPEFIRFEFGDMYQECNQCSEKTLLSEGIKDGVQFVLPTTDLHEFKLTCQKCNNMMRLFWKESSPETAKKSEEDYQKYLQMKENLEAAKANVDAEANDLEKAIEQSDEVLQEDTKETFTERTD